MAQNLKKKLSNLGKKKNCDIVNAWIKSIVKHFWWMRSTCNGYSYLKEKCLSLLYHIRGYTNGKLEINKFIVSMKN